MSCAAHRAVSTHTDSSYVHRLIQSRTDGKLVELPSASSLVSTNTGPLPFGSLPATPARPSRPAVPSSLTAPSSPLAAPSEPDAGPTNNDVEKMSTIESITLEYSYLLSSQLESMRQHYETRLLESESQLESLREAQARADAAEKAKQEAENARLKAERRSEKASELTRSLQASLSAERAMSEGLTARINKLREVAAAADKIKKEKEDEVKNLEETVRDLMFSLEAGRTIRESGGADGGAGGQIVVAPSSKGKDKGKKKK